MKSALGKRKLIQESQQPTPPTLDNSILFTTAPPTPHNNNTRNNNEITSRAELEDLYEKSLEAINSFHHPLLLSRMKLLERVKEKQILLADRMKKLRMKDALQLYEYEVTDAQSQYKRSLEESKLALLQDLQTEKLKVLDSFQQQQQQQQRATPTNNKNSSNNNNNNTFSAFSSSTANLPSDPSLSLSAPITTTAATGPVTTSTSSSSSQQAYPLPSRFTRSALPQTSSNAQASKENNNHHNSTNHGATNGVELSSSSHLGNINSNKKVKPSFPTYALSISSSSLGKSLPESLIKNDFQEIIQDLQEQENHLQETKPQKLQGEISYSDDGSSITLKDQIFHVGDFVEVFSVLSQETMIGFLMTIDGKKGELMIRTGSGIRFRIFEEQLRTGRLILSIDQETAESLSLIASAQSFLSSSQKI